MEQGFRTLTTGATPSGAPSGRVFAWWPRLTEDQGRDFQRERRDREHSLARRNVGLSAVLCVLFAVPEVSTMTDLVPLALGLRLGVLTPLMLVTYPVRLLGRRRDWALLEEVPQALVGLAVQAVATVLLIMTGSPHAVGYAFASLPVMIAFAMILRVRLPLAMATLTGICALGLVGVLGASVLTTAWVSAAGDILVATLLLLLVMVVSREVELRRTFLLRVRLAELLAAREEDFAALEEANAQLAELTELDELTRLPNRRALQTRLDQWDTQGRWGLIAMVDVDRFKLFNDVHGHATGDEVLRLVAHAMQERMRADGGFVARYGGEEFTLVLPGADAVAGTAVTERLRAAVEATNLDGLAVTISIGWAIGEAGDFLSSTRLLQRADDAVLAAKAAGRNRVVRWQLAGASPVDEGGHDRAAAAAGL